LAFFLFATFICDRGGIVAQSARGRCFGYGCDGIYWCCGEFYCFGGIEVYFPVVWEVGVWFGEKARVYGPGFFYWFKQGLYPVFNLTAVGKTSSLKFYNF